jgi:hypothetical protein
VRYCCVYIHIHLRTLNHIHTYSHITRNHNPALLKHLNATYIHTLIYSHSCTHTHTHTPTYTLKLTLSHSPAASQNLSFSSYFLLTFFLLSSYFLLTFFLLYTYTLIIYYSPALHEQLSAIRTKTAEIAEYFGEAEADEDSNTIDTAIDNNTDNSNDGSALEGGDGAEFYAVEQGDSNSNSNSSFLTCSKIFAVLQELRAALAHSRAGAELRILQQRHQPQ